jgi:hypothetical protein
MNNNLKQNRYCDSETGEALRPGVTCCNETSNCNQPDPSQLDVENLLGLIFTFQAAFPAANFTDLLATIKDSNNATFIADSFFATALNSDVVSLRAVSTALFDAGTIKSQLVSKITSGLPDSLKAQARSAVASALNNANLS